MGLKEPEEHAYADERGIAGGNYKKLNLPFENKLLGQTAEVRERMVVRVEAFVYGLLSNVFNATDTAPVAIATCSKPYSSTSGAVSRLLR